MNDSPTFCAIYDFELLPYALGDVLTWNVQTAIKAAEAGRSRVDIFVCVDPRYPASVYQRGLITDRNAFLFFSELLGAFGTHPFLVNIHVHTDRDSMIRRLEALAVDDPVNAEALSDYQAVLARRDDEDALKDYFLKYIYSHQRLNAYAAAHGGIPLLRQSLGCEPDIEGLMMHRLAGKRTVIIHPRLRKLDAGYAGHHTYSRDSDFLEWYDFVRKAGETHPEVQFVVAGRLQEKPLELLRLPNVMSLRALGLGLGHELTLMQRADLFIGTSSGFAAMANFSAVPYFITHMNKESCNAYAIEEGASRLPFAAPDQELIYEPESADMLMRLLERGLALAPRGVPAPETPAAVDAGFDIDAWDKRRRAELVPSATTSRFFVDDGPADLETAYLIRGRVEQGLDALAVGDRASAEKTAQRLSVSFPRLVEKYPDLKKLAEGAKPPVAKVAFWRARNGLLSISGRKLPRWVHGTIIHRVLRRAKDIIAGYERR